MSEPPDESLLVSAAKCGDRSAFARLHELYARMVHGILLARVPRSEAADLVQEVFLTALRKLPGLRDSGRFGPWLARVARNRATDWHRRTRKLVELEDDTAAPAALDEDLDAERVLEAVRKLPDAYRTTLLLRFAEGLTGPEIAVKTGLSPGSVRVNLHRGMKQLREALGWEKVHETER